jgi:hypothetical protein
VESCGSGLIGNSLLLHPLVPPSSTGAAASRFGFDHEGGQNPKSDFDDQRSSSVGFKVNF